MASCLKATRYLQNEYVGVHGVCTFGLPLIHLLLGLLYILDPFILEGIHAFGRILQLCLSLVQCLSALLDLVAHLLLDAPLSDS